MAPFAEGVETDSSDAAHRRWFNVSLGSVNTCDISTEANETVTAMVRAIPILAMLRKRALLALGSLLSRGGKGDPPGWSARAWSVGRYERRVMKIGSGVAAVA